MNNTLKINLAFAEFLGDNISFHDIDKRDQIISFLDTRYKITTIEEDPDKKWITTWNDYLSHIKYFFRWLYNWKMRNTDPNRGLPDVARLGNPIIGKNQVEEDQTPEPVLRDRTVR